MESQTGSSELVMGEARIAGESRLAKADIPDPTVIAGLRVGSDRSRFACLLLLAIGDLAAVTIAIAAAYLVWAGGQLRQPTSLYTGIFPVLLLFPLVYGVAGLYPGFGLGPVETFRRLSIATSATFVMLGALAFALKLSHVYSRFTLALAWLASLALVPLVRSGLAALASSRRWWGEPVVVVGKGIRRDEVVLELLRHPARGYHPVAAVAREGERGAGSVAGVPTIGDVGAAPELARHGIRVALLVQEELALGPLGAWLQGYFRHVIVLRGLCELPVEHVEVRNLGEMLGIEFSNQLLQERNWLMKRALDLFVLVLAVPFALPVIGLLALLIKLSSRGPAFFFQDREGLNGRRIRVRKLRTMHIDAEERLGEFLRGDAEARHQWEQRYKLAHDPRVIPYLGVLLRRLSLDELPQLFNIILGEMSFVGPRPFPEYHLRRFPPEFQELRRRVRPGLTGLWQVTVRSEGSVADQQRYDTYYIRNWSVWLDIYIMARTVAAVISGRGAY